MGRSYRLVQPKLTLKNIIDIREDQDYSLTTSPFGVTPQQYEEEYEEEPETDETSKTPPPPPPQ